MKKISILLLAIFTLFSSTISNAQINLGERALGALSNAVKGFTFSDEDAATLSRDAVAKMDKSKPVNLLFRRGEWAQYALIRPAK